MRPGLDPGVFHELTATVTDDMCPHFDGKLVHRVYSTWSLVHHMELAGRRVLVPHLEPHEEAVGGGISVRHRSPAIVGSDVRVRATVKSLVRGRLLCDTHAWCGTRLLADGEFVQVIMEKRVLEALLAKCAEESGA